MYGGTCLVCRGHHAMPCQTKIGGSNCLREVAGYSLEFKIITTSVADPGVVRLVRSNPPDPKPNSGLVLSISCFRSSWSRKLIERASKTQYVDLPSVNPSELRERGVVIRCANFSVDALRSEESEKSRSHGKSGPKLPIITSDKKTFNIPDDVYNPAFQISMTLYHYPDKCGTKFLREFMTENSLSLLCVHSCHTKQK